MWSCLRMCNGFQHILRIRATLRLNSSHPSVSTPVTHRTAVGYVIPKKHGEFGIEVAQKSMYLCGSFLNQTSSGGTHHVGPACVNFESGLDLGLTGESTLLRTKGRTLA